MGLIKYRLGDCLELYNQKCGKPNLTIWDISGVNSEKEFFEPSKQAGADTSNYKIVPTNYFACNLMHVGRDKVLPIALNHTEMEKIVSPAYTIFKIKEGTPLLKEFFFIMLKSSEQDRYFWFHTDSSIRDGMSWDDFCDLIINLPSVEIQQKYVDIYNSMLANQQCYERGLEDLKTVLEGYMDNLKHGEELKAIGDYIELSDDRNTDLEYGLDAVRGISIEKKLIDTKADMTGVSLRPYYLLKPNYFGYVTVTSRNGEKVSLALNNTEDTFICSSSYVVFKAKDENILWPKYLMLFLNRSEFDRYARFNSWGSARETFDWQEMCEVKIPIPNLEVQKSIANIYNVYLERKAINEKLKAQIKDICPILIKGSLEEASR